MIRSLMLVTAAALALLACKPGAAKLDPAKDRCERADGGVKRSSPRSTWPPARSRLVSSTTSAASPAYLDDPAHLHVEGGGVP